MGARQKLNGIHFGGTLLLAGAAGLVTQSWPVFALALLALLAGSLITGEIRPGRRGGHGRRHGRGDSLNQDGGQE